MEDFHQFVMAIAWILITVCFGMLAVGFFWHGNLIWGSVCAFNVVMSIVGFALTLRGPSGQFQGSPI